MTGREFKYHFKLIPFDIGKKGQLLINSSFKRRTKIQRQSERFDRWLKKNNASIEISADGIILKTW